MYLYQLLPAPSNGPGTVLNEGHPEGVTPGTFRGRASSRASGSGVEMFESNRIITPTSFRLAVEPLDTWLIFCSRSSTLGVQDLNLIQVCNHHGALTVFSTQ